MIYLVTKNSLPSSEMFSIISVEKSIEMLKSLTIIGLDTETTSLSPHLGTLLTVQLGCSKFQIVIDCTTIDIKLYRGIIEDPKILKIGHNLVFDIQWFYKEGIIPRNLYDTFLAEKLIWLGYPYMTHPWIKVGNKRKQIIPRTGDWEKDIYGLGLGDIAMMYLGVEMDKTVRGEIIWRGLDERVITYSACDVEHLEDIMKAQYPSLQAEGLFKAVKIECEFVRVLAYIEFCGAKLDQKAWKEKMIRDSENLEKCILALNSYVEKLVMTPILPKEPQPPNMNGTLDSLPTSVVDKLIKDFRLKHEAWKKECYRIEHLTKPEMNSTFSKYVTVNLQGDLWSGFDTRPKCSINWNSKDQVASLLKDLGVCLDSIDKDTKEKKESIEESVLKPQKDKFEIIPLFLEYQGVSKLCTTYGQNWLDAVDPTTGRIYTKFFQLLDTARLSCGGGIDKPMSKLKGKEVKYCNVQTLPKEELTRACFIAEEGYRWISADYKGWLMAHTPEIRYQ